MSTELHTMVVSTPTGTETHTWNGKAEDRDAAKAVFEAKLGTNAYLAYKTVTPESPATPGVAPGKPKYEQIREFDPEADRIMLTPRLVGGSN